MKFLDLTLPQYWLPTYDWVICLEVLEHIPAEFENIVLDNIRRVAAEGAVISWAVPGQGGYNHINLQPSQHVEKVFALRGFERDDDKTAMLQNAASLKWLKNNVIVFRRRESNNQ